jgi:hypothetical protein
MAAMLRARSAIIYLFYDEVPAEKTAASQLLYTEWIK